MSLGPVGRVAQFHANAASRRRAVIPTTQNRCKLIDDDYNTLVSRYLSYMCTAVVSSDVVLLLYAWDSALGNIGDAMIVDYNS